MKEGLNNDVKLWGIFYMIIFKKVYGKIVYGLAKCIETIFAIFIYLVESIIGVVKSIGKGLLSIISMGGILFFLLIGPRILFNPLATLVIIFLIVFPILGSKFVSYLKYIKYSMTEYLFDYADNLINGRKTRFQSFGEYGRKYRRMEEERRREEQDKRQKAQQKEWEERFRQWTEYQNSQRNGDYGSYSWNSQNYGYKNQVYTNPNIDFKNRYEKSCDLLDINYKSDKYEIKLAYRKKAKEYHPDVNKALNATQKFQEINDAYEFLSDTNIERYKNLN